MIDGKRRKRIARGSGTSVQEVNQVLKQYLQMRTMMKQYGALAAQGRLKGLSKDSRTRLQKKSNARTNALERMKRTEAQPTDGGAAPGPAANCRCVITTANGASRSRTTANFSSFWSWMLRRRG